MTPSIRLRKRPVRGVRSAFAAAGAAGIILACGAIVGSNSAVGVPIERQGWASPAAVAGSGPQPSISAAAQKPSLPVLTLAATAAELKLTEGLAVGLVGFLGRSPVPSDLVAWQLAAGTLAAPREGGTVGANSAGQAQSWARVEAGADGWIQNRVLAGGSLWVIVNSEKARTVIFEASSYYVARINGEPRGGEKYGSDWVRHPVRLVKGRNEFLIQCERGRFRGRLVAPTAEVFFTDADMTVPDLVLGEKGPVWAGLRLVNATGERLTKVEIVWRAGGREGRAELDVTVAPFMTQKLAIPLSINRPAVEGPIPIEIKARARAGGRSVETPAFKVELTTVAPSEHHSRTFRSGIDGSVQYFAVAPRLAGGDGAPPTGTMPGLVLTLHGAGVEAIGQARAYKPKDWAHVVAPTNRRPYGFDWEDWGRLDALEVLAEASRLFGTDPDRAYLTGHSMGGHGTWQVGATVPGLWAAIAPSAGWPSFSSYGGGVIYKDPSPVERMLARATNPSETGNLARNYLPYGIYILHGDQDDNVPVTQARTMRELLGKFHPDFAYYERPGAGHWWGNECVDWPPLFEFLKERVRPADAAARQVEFVTANPGISSRSRWVEVLAQARPLEYSKVVVEKDEAGTAVKGTTENVLRLALDVAAPAGGSKFMVELDGSRVEASAAPGAARIYLERGEKGWAATGPPPPGLKGPHRSGGFKDAFRHGFVLVYGTLGDAAEDARAFGKARFDAEMFWVRGNAGIEVIADTAFDPAGFKDRSVVLYGNADTNGAWQKLLAGCPVEVRNGRARVGDRNYEGADLAAYFVRPRPRSDVASVGVVAWSGRAGWVAASPGQYFISGAGFPDLMLFTAETLRSGADGVRAIGWFGDDWSLEKGDIVWNDGRQARSSLSPEARLKDDLAFLEAETKKLLEGCIIKAADGTPLYTPDGQAHYAALWTRDFASMVEYAGDLMPREKIEKCIAYLMRGIRADGAVPDRVQVDGRAVYTAGPPDAPPGEPNIDNAQFLVFAVNFYLELVPEATRAGLYRTWSPLLVRGMDDIPRASNGLVWNDPRKPHSPYGFTDTVAKTGDLFMESLLYWRASKMLARWESAYGSPKTRDDFETRAAAIEKSIGSLWDDRAGMFFAASIDCRQTDIWGNAYAVDIGFPLAGKKQRIVDALVANYDRFVWKGQVRHLPPGEYWQRLLMPVGKEKYQNGAFWATPAGWVMGALNGRAPELARRMLADLVEDFRAGGICECVNVGYRNLPSYVNSATNPRGAARKLWRE